MGVKVQGGFLGLMAIRDESGQQMNQEGKGLRWRECSIWQMFLS